MQQVLVFGSEWTGKLITRTQEIARWKYYPAGSPPGAIVEGRYGRCYAIPVTNQGSLLRRECIYDYVLEFLAHAKDNRRDEFIVTRIGCGRDGYLDEDIAPMFEGYSENCTLPSRWAEIIAAIKRG